MKKNLPAFLFTLTLLPFLLWSNSGRDLPPDGSLLRNFTRLPNFQSGSFLQHYLPPEMKKDTPAVILVHGLFMNGYHMSYLGVRLSKLGYYCITYDYPTRRKTISGHGEDFRILLEDFCRKNPHRKIHIITHSMGGLLTRYALGNLTPGEGGNIRSVLMLAPPNHGSATADFVCKYLEKLCVYFPPVPGLRTAPDSECRNLPMIPERIRLGILGADLDHLVNRHSATLQGMDHFELIRFQTHSSLPLSPKVFPRITAFLRESTSAH